MIKRAVWILVPVKVVVEDDAENASDPIVNVSRIVSVQAPTIKMCRQAMNTLPNVSCIKTMKECLERLFLLADHFSFETVTLRHMQDFGAGR